MVGSLSSSTTRMQGVRIVRRSQSAWIMDQMARYRSVERTPAFWRVLHAQFTEKYPHGGVGGEPITLERYRSHALYVLRKDERGRAALVEAARQSDDERRGVAMRSKRRRDEMELQRDDASLDDAAGKRPRHKLRTKAAEAAKASERHARAGPAYTQCEARQAFADDVAVKQEMLTHESIECARLETELQQCRASLKRMKQSAHEWKVKYEELLASTTVVKPPLQPPQPSSTHVRNEHAFTFTINVNVDVAKGGQHVHTDSHAVEVTSGGDSKPVAEQVVTDQDKQVKV